MSSSSTTVQAATQSAPASLASSIVSSLRRSALEAGKEPAAHERRRASRRDARRRLTLPFPAFACLLLASMAAAAESPAATARLSRVAPSEAGMSLDRLQRIDQVVGEGLAAKRMPGCVVAVGRHGKLVYLKAYGHRQLEPTRKGMTVDTLFDLASLTKPIATATSIMILVQRGKLRLHDRVSLHVPEFAQNGKERVTILQLLTHQGGLIPDNSLKDYQDGPEKAMERIFALDLREPPGTRFIYSDLGYIVLAEIVHRVSGKDIGEFSRDNTFRPLGMSETGYLPRLELRARAAATQQRCGHWMVGEVHDPRAYRLGGIAGHAGLFSTAGDLAVYAQMLLDGGRYGGVRILSPATVAAMTRPYPVSSGLRGLGWDVQTGYSSNRGELFSSHAYGHGGFTGTALWIDPELDLFVLFLSNRVHPDGKGSVNSLAGRIGSIAAAAVEGIAPAPGRRSSRRRPSAGAHAAVLTGLDVLQRDRFRLLQGGRVGLITNQTGLNREGVSTIQLLREAPGVHLAALFSPEHGLEGHLETANIADSRDAASGLDIFSLYGESRAPTAEQLQGIDTLVFDIQDIGARFYTYISTMKNAMRAAAENDVRFVVLDRPNPINGVDVSGPVLDEGAESFVGYHRLPVRHGMTAGELARMFNDESQLGVELNVVRMENWRPADYFDATGLLWINPSPNMRSLTEALLYPGVGLLETTNLSVGRGTDTPFERIGAPWLDGVRLARALHRARLPGVRFVPIAFTPSASTFAGQPCGGVNIIVTNRRAFQPLRTGLEIARQLRRLYPDAWQADAMDHLLGSEKTLQALLRGVPTAEVESAYRDDLDAFLKRRAAYLLY